MPPIQPLEVNLSQQNSSLQLMPRAALLSSQRLKWQKIHVQAHCQPAWETPESVFKQHTIVIHHSMAQVERTLDGRRRNEQVGCGNSAIIPANISHKVNWDREASFTLLALEPEHMAQIAYESVDSDHTELIPHFTQSDSFIHQMGLSLKAEMELHELGSRLFVDSLVTALSVHLLRHYAVRRQPLRHEPGGLSKYQLQQAIDYINDSLDQDLSLEAIAAEVGMSQYYFCRLFKQSMGLAPYQYVIQQRVERAKALLKQTKLSLSEIALQCGFAS